MISREAWCQNIRAPLHDDSKQTRGKHVEGVKPPEDEDFVSGPFGNLEISCFLQLPVVSLLLTLWAPFHSVVQGICLSVYLGEQ